MDNNTLTWYRLFDASEVASVPYLERNFDLEQYGPVAVRLVKGNLTALVFDGFYLCPGINGRNPVFTRDRKLGAYLDDAGFLWFGVQL